MARPNTPQEAWQADAVELMIRSGISLRQAANELEIPLTTAEAENIQRRKSFQRLLQTSRSRYYAEVGADPGVTKTALIGKLLLLSDKLMEEGEWDKTAEVLFKVGKLQNWVGADSSVNVFHGLTSKELEEARKRLVERTELNATVN